MSGNDKDLSELKEVTLVVRSEVPEGLPYGEYRPFLRADFMHSCAYCTMSEAEAMAIRFTIDHYEPKSIRPELENLYSNLMYACDECNTRKGPRTVPEAAKQDGIRFYRPDCDEFSAHFERSNLLLKGLTKIAEYTIDAVDLNRLSLRRVREIRARLATCEEMISAGIRGLMSVRVDQLPPTIRKNVMDAAKQLDEAHNSVDLALREILRSHARSPLLDEDPDADQLRRERLERLKGTEALYPNEVWRPKRG